MNPASSLMFIGDYKVVNATYPRFLPAQFCQNYIFCLIFRVSILNKNHDVTRLSKTHGLLTAKFQPT